MTDEQLLNADEVSELIKRYVDIIVIKGGKLARASSQLNRQDAEDFISEGLLGLLSAIRTYEESKGLFCAYANACIDNRMKNALGKAKRTLGFVYRLGEVDPALMSSRLGQSPGADDILIEKESKQEILSRIRRLLSEREYRVFEMYLDSFSYRQIAARLNISEKSVDNALSRARIKLKQLTISNE